MIGQSLRITYVKGRAFAAYFYLPHAESQKSDHTKQFFDEIVVDFDEKDKPIGIEIISPGYVSKEEVAAVLSELGLNPALIEEFEPVFAESARKKAS
jgi:uncharacterized protein YuzE